VSAFAKALGDGAVPDDGGPVDARVVEQAVAWYVRRASGLQPPEDADAFSQWHAAHPDHARAWQRLQTVGGRLRSGAGRVSAPLTRAALAQATTLPRRRVLKTLAWAGVGGTALVVAQREAPWRSTIARTLADVRTATGERRDLVLADGTRLLLNTATAIDVRFDAQRRLIALHAGEILVTTAHDPAGRPFVVSTRDGTLTPVGTRFTVRRDETLDDAQGFTQLAVEQGVVEIRAAAAVPAEAVRVRAGEQARFTRHDVDARAPLDDGALSWTDGKLTAERMRLADLLAELDRYRSGRLRCDPAVADLRVTGIWPLADAEATDQVLASLERTLPVKVSRFTRYWVSVGPTAAR
jgi:transmembrane sensor